MINKIYIKKYFELIYFYAMYIDIGKTHCKILMIKCYKERRILGKKKEASED